MSGKSKSLGHSDESGFDFVKELLQGDPTFAIDFERLQFHKKLGYIIFEFLLCEEGQVVSRHTSHPNRYWNKNSRKFISLWEATQALSATLYLVNYAKIGTKHADKITMLKVLEVNAESGIVRERKKEFTRAEFSSWFRKLNRECS